METTTVIMILLFQYVILTGFYAMYKALLQFITPISNYTWAGLVIPVFGLVFGFVKLMIFAIKD